MHVMVEGDVSMLHDQGMEFMPNRDHTWCAICGAIYQHPLSRLPFDELNAEVSLTTLLARKAWAKKHAKTHSNREHAQLRISGRKVTPEAALRLSTYGIIALTDIVMSEEHERAAREAGRKPLNDVEGVKY